MGSIGTTDGNGIGHGSAAAARRQHAEGPAAMLGIGTANPTGLEVPQNVFAENLFRVTKSDHLTELQQKLTRICEKTGIDKRHFHLTEETLAAHPELYDHDAPSLDNRLAMTVDAVPKLAQCAAGQGHRRVGPPGERDHPPHLQHLLRLGRPERRPAARHAARPPPHGQPHHPQPPRLLRRRQGAGPRQGARREQPRRARPRGLRRDHARLLRRARRRQPRRPRHLRGRRRRGHRRRRALRRRRAEPDLRDGPRHADHGAQNRARARHAGLRQRRRLPPRHPGAHAHRAERGALPPRRVPRRRHGDDDDGAHLPSPLSGNGKWNDLFWVVHPGGRQILDNIDKVLQLEPEKLGQAGTCSASTAT
uniref:Chalcone/stilbene synthase N-terminal domain-containing protein n=1 Tax=Triticum urartu TaxID=4572 RepID=A0A8R7URM9_TRIUA